MAREQFVCFNNDTKFTLGYEELFDFNGIPIITFISATQ